MNEYISQVTINERRMETVSFSYPYIQTGLSFAYRPETLDKARASDFAVSVLQRT